MNKPNIQKSSMDKLIRHFNKRFETQYRKITAWEWKEERLGTIFIYFDGGENETDTETWDRKRGIDIYKDDHFRVFQELNELIGVF